MLSNFYMIREFNFAINTFIQCNVSFILSAMHTHSTAHPLSLSWSSHFFFRRAFMHKAKHCKMNAEDIAPLVGHKSFRTTMIYIQNLKPRMQEYINVVSKISALND